LVDPTGLNNFPPDVVVSDPSNPGKPNAFKYDPDRDWGDWDPVSGGRKNVYDPQVFRKDLQLFVVVVGDGCEIAVGTIWAPASWALDTRDMGLAIRDVKDGHWISGSICVAATSIGYLPGGDLVKKPVNRTVQWIRKGLSKEGDVAIERIAQETAQQTEKLAAESQRLYRGVPDGTPRGNLARQGYAKPRGTAVDDYSLRKHVLGENVDAGVTSWTPDRDVAKRFSGADGTVLEVDASSVSDRVVPRPNVGKYVDEKEVLLMGTIEGTPTKP
jgi:hypothetical protein